MAILQMALIVKARRELILSAGEFEKGALSVSSFEHLNEEIETLDGPAYLKVGVARIGSVNISGAEVVNMDYPADSLAISWYLPAEEGVEDARPVELEQVGVVPSVLPRGKAEPGHSWRFRVDGRGPYSETLFYDSGFLPPFKSSDVSLHLTDIGNFGYKTLILTSVMYGHKAPVFTSGDLGLHKTIAQGVLED
ncbi:MAG: hypothetical protein LBR53_04535 [Deltaproteobacteria bacterium]|jgi:hypothetical protein|nr:hypothetical protein [Deltaproteobacteria bacterium]